MGFAFFCWSTNWHSHNASWHKQYPSLLCTAFDEVNIVHNFHLTINWKVKTLLSSKYLANATFGEGVGEGVDLLLLEGLLLSGVANFWISGGDKFLTLIKGGCYFRGSFLSKVYSTKYLFKVALSFALQIKEVTSVNENLSTFSYPMYIARSY